VRSEPVMPPWFFDAHCDTFLRVVENGAEFEAAGGLHVTLPGLLAADARMQVFAAWTLAERLQGEEDQAAMRMVEAVAAACRANPERMLLVRTASDLDAVEDGPGRVAAICGLESADPLKGDPRALLRFQEAGVRVLTLAWGDNAFCGSCFGRGDGLSDKGEELVALCEEQGVVVDVSHASDTAFWDVCRVSEKPFIASHSNSRALCDSPRNLSDEMVRVLAERGGVVGLNLYSGFLSGEFAAELTRFYKDLEKRPGSVDLSFDEKGALVTDFQASLPHPPLSLVVDHIKHLISVGGEDCVGLGGDLDGCDSLPEGLDSVLDYPKIAARLRESGISSSQVAKVCHGNFARVFRDLLP